MPKHHTAEFLPIAGEYIIPRRKLTGYPSEKIRIENCAEGLKVDIVAFVAAMPSRRIEINKFWPRDWWQAFRERWFPAWWLNYWPVRYERVWIDRQLYSHVCPHLQKDPEHIHLDFLASGESLEEIIVNQTENLLRKIKGILAGKQNKKKSIRYLVHLDSRRQRNIVIVTKDWLVGKETYTTSTYFHAKENWSNSSIKLQIDLMPGPEGVL